MNVLLNGEERHVAEGATVADVVASLPGTPDGRGVAVAVDGLVVRRAEWSNTSVAPGARIEVVVAVQGG